MTIVSKSGELKAKRLIEEREQKMKFRNEVAKELAIELFMYRYKNNKKGYGTKRGIHHKTGRKNIIDEIAELSFELADSLIEKSGVNYESKNN